MNPLPGTATEQDVLNIEARENRLCETRRRRSGGEDAWAFRVQNRRRADFFLETFLDRHDLGIVYGADGTLRIIPHLVRIPDVADCHRFLAQHQTQMPPAACRVMSRRAWE